MADGLSKNLPWPRRYAPLNFSMYRLPWMALGLLSWVALGLFSLGSIPTASAAELLELGSIDTPGQAFGVSVVGTLAYVADGGSGLRVVDISEWRTSNSKSDGV